MCCSDMFISSTRRLRSILVLVYPVVSLQYKEGLFDIDVVKWWSGRSRSWPKKKVVSPIMSRLQGRGTDVMVSFLHLAWLVQHSARSYLLCIVAPQLYNMNFEVIIHTRLTWKYCGKENSLSSWFSFLSVCELKVS